MRSPAEAAVAPGLAAVTRAGVARMATALTATLTLAAAAWVEAVRLMGGMAMGPATRLGSFGFFITVWAVMMAAMMLPGAARAVVRSAQAGGVRAAGLFAVSYLSVWAAAGAVVYAAYRPHGTVAAGLVAIAAGSYELTPVKQHFRRRCRGGADAGVGAASGLGFGLCCAGSTAGLMALLVAMGVMSIPWMAVITVVVLAQKLLPPMMAVDLPLALAIIGLGILIILAPAAVPGLSPPM